MDASATAKNEKKKKNSSKCSWDNPNKRHMEKGDIVSLVGKNCPRDSLKTSNLTSIQESRVRAYAQPHIFQRDWSSKYMVISTAILSSLD